MAANSQSRGFARLGKRAVTKIWNSSCSRDPAHLSPSAASLRRGVHYSVYDKNPEEPVRPALVPDNVIQSQSETYWAPHPQTGVFGPAEESGFHSAPAKGDNGNGNTDAGESVLEQKAWFRPLEDVDKPPPQP
ncbi:hypothetical protein RJ641_007853 [Dillenia turbinata]|uniref:Late embryogenesis abundant protein At5g17165-like n=1 Tax=Dillenia turbinata TaxID=194707 RepID=A0AAN8V717_9MAGN